MLPQYELDQHMPTNWIQSSIVHAEQSSDVSNQLMYSLSGIAPPSIRRDVCARVENAKQETNEAYSLYGKSQKRDA